MARKALLPRDYRKREKPTVRDKGVETFKRASYFIAQGHWLLSRFPSGRYENVPGLCKAVILAMDRPIVGGGLKLAWIKDQDLPSLLVQRVSRIRGIANISRTRFLRYVLSDVDFLAHIDRITTGANIPHISGKDIASYVFRLPSLDEQDRAVELLSAYDDLIERNQLRISLLEESARLVFREWFVNLRFPGFRLQASSSSLPEGWGRGAMPCVAPPKQPARLSKLD